jgi:hypothetical protein
MYPRANHRELRLIAACRTSQIFASARGHLLLP